MLTSLLHAAALRGLALRLPVAVLLLGMSLAVSAQTARTVTEGYEDILKRARVVATLGSDLFGEQVSLADGSTTFQATDVSVPTTSGLSVSVSRVLGINAKDIDQYGDPARDGELFGDWRLSVPMMSGVFDARTGWAVQTSTPAKRCSNPEYWQQIPPNVSGIGFTNTTYYASQYWAGNRISIPGKGDENLLYLPPGNARPGDGRVYYATTKSNWKVACLPTLKNGAGEGFLVVLPDGTRYFFDWVSTRTVSPIQAVECATNFGCVEKINLNRNEVFLHATRVEDRFGNWVDYQYDPASPRQLTGISSSDGASISLTYVAGKVDTMTAAGKTWRYLYADANRRVLSQVVLPDSSAWTFATSNLLQVTRSNSRFLWYDCVVNVGSMASSQPMQPGAGGSVTITHPSGATGTFLFRKLVHGTNDTPGYCSDPSPDKYGDEQVSDIVSAYQAASLYSKAISGPGLPTETWSYTYEPSWSWESESPAGFGDPRSTTRVTAPNGVVTVYSFGNSYHNNAGQLLDVRVEMGGVLQQTTQTTYLASANGYAFPARIGYDTNSRNNPRTTEQLHPETTRRTVRDGHSFEWRVDTGCSAASLYCFDAWARPTRQVRRSAPAP